MQRLESERLILRGFTEQDTDDLYRYAVDPDVGPRAGWKPHESREESLSIIRMFIEEGDVFAIRRPCYWTRCPVSKRIRIIR